MKKIAATRPVSTAGGAVGGGIGGGGPFGSRGTPGAAPMGPMAPARGGTSRVLYDAIYEAAKALEPRPSNRRKIIVLVSDGEVDPKQNTHSQVEVINLLQRDEIQLYCVSTVFGPYEKLFGSNLTTYAHATGGDVYNGGSTAAMEQGFLKITEEARNQYVLGYVSNNEVKGNTATFRNIVVKTTTPGLKVTYRKRYLQYPPPQPSTSKP